MLFDIPFLLFIIFHTFQSFHTSLPSPPLPRPCPLYTPIPSPLTTPHIKFQILISNDKSEVVDLSIIIVMHMEIAHLGQTSTAALQVTLSSDYGWVVLVAVLLACEIVAIGFLFPGRARGKAFNKDFMEQHFALEHKQATGKDIGSDGYPDMGSGRYSQKLTYEQWYTFNNYQRVHANYLEFAPSIFIALLAAGIYYPIPAAAVGLVLFVARLVYSIGYVSGGPGGRVVGALGSHFSLFALLGLGFASGAYLVQGKSMD